MIILDGKKVAGEVRAALSERIAAFTSKTGRAPHLAVVIVGDDPASHIYVKNKKKACESAGMTSTIHTFPVSLSQEQLEAQISKLNSDDSVDGILVQFPLPHHLDSRRVLAVLSPAKDADGLSYLSLGYLYSGHAVVQPCTPRGVITMLKRYNIPISGKRAVVVGRSNIVGKPMAHLLMEENATVTICHSKTQNIRELMSQADIVVVAAGKPLLFGKEDFKKDAVVVDVGIHRGQNNKLCGDVRFEELSNWAQAASPVPGGVGPMTIASLLENTCALAEKRAGLK